MNSLEELFLEYFKSRYGHLDAMCPEKISLIELDFYGGAAAAMMASETHEKETVINALAGHVVRIDHDLTNQRKGAIMPNLNTRTPGEMTDHELLLALAPDFMERLDAARPELRAEIVRRAAYSGSRCWKPLEFMKGCL